MASVTRIDRPLDVLIQGWVFLWGFGNACLIVWLLIKRKPMLTSPIFWKQMAFFSLGSGSTATLLFWVTIAFILLPGADIFEGLAFFALNGLFSPLLFVTTTGFGLAYSIARLSPRLEETQWRKAFTLSALLVFGGVGLILAAWSFFSDFFNIALRNLTG